MTTANTRVSYSVAQVKSSKDNLRYWTSSHALYENDIPFTIVLEGSRWRNLVWSSL